MAPGFPEQKVIPSVTTLHRPPKEPWTGEANVRNVRLDNEQRVLASISDPLKATAAAKDTHTGSYTDTHSR